MENLTELFSNIHPALLVLGVLLIVVAIVAQWSLYEKAGQPGVASIIPIWNIIAFLKIVGRPWTHMFLVLIPIYGQLYFVPKLWIEICQAFGRRKMSDYVLCILFNGFYVMNLGLSEANYEGAVYGSKKSKDSLAGEPQLAA
jgi:hypothetical protein